MNDDQNGGRDDSSPSWPALDHDTLSGVLAKTIGKQSADEAWIARVDGGVVQLQDDVRSLQRSVDALAARTDAWQRDTTEHLRGIDGRVRMLTNQVFVIQMLKVGGQALLACFAGGVFAEVLTFVLTRH